MFPSPKQIRFLRRGLIAGPLADQVFEPAMKPDGSLAWLFGSIFGIDKGAGMALLYFLCALCMFLVGVFGFNVHLLRNIEEKH